MLEKAALKVLLVEDVRMIRAMILNQLAELGVTEVPTASDGGQALETLGREPDVDIILCDWHMEPMDGLTFCARVRSHPGLGGRHIPVVFMTCDDRLADSDKRRRTLEPAKGLGIVGILLKPLTTDDLRAALTRYTHFDPVTGAG